MANGSTGSQEPDDRAGRDHFAELLKVVMQSTSSESYRITELSVISLTIQLTKAAVRLANLLNSIDWR